MAQLVWEKSPLTEKAKHKPSASAGRLKLLMGGGLLLAVIAILVLSGTLTGARFFLSVDTVVSNPSYVGQTVRLTGAVIGESIRYDAETGDLSFTIVHVPDTFDDLAAALHEAVNDPTRTRITIVMTDQVKPDLLQHEAQAILTGQLNPDGTFTATELNLKCPSRFGDELPAVNGTPHPPVQTS